MSEPIQSIAQNNYILATQQEVSHDNTLSGNGTVDSPLGLNETVLFTTAVESAVSACTLSENRNNFEYIHVFLRDDNNLGVFETNMFPSQTACAVVSIYGPNDKSWFGVRQLAASATNTTLNAITTSQISWTSAGAFRNYGSNNNLTKIVKVIGVNRISG